MAEIKKMLQQLSGDETRTAMVRGLNKTMDGTRTDGTKILTDKYALTATAIRKTFNVRKCAFRDPNGAVSSKGTFLRLKEFGAKQNDSGVSVKILKKNPRKTIQHAFMAKLRSGQGQEQAYRRIWHDEKHASQTSILQKQMARKGYVWSYRQRRWIPAKWLDKYQATGDLGDYRLPIRALYGPRIQDYLGDANVMSVLLRLSGERLKKNMAHEVEYLLNKAKSL